MLLSTPTPIASLPHPCQEQIVCHLILFPAATSTQKENEFLAFFVPLVKNAVGPSLFRDLGNVHRLTELLNWDRDYPVPSK